MKLLRLAPLAFVALSVPAIAASPQAPAEAPAEAPATQTVPAKPMKPMKPAGSMQQKRMHLMQPMPNLMRVIVQNADRLELDEQQVAAFEAWRNANHDEVHARMDAIREIQKKMQHEVLRGANLARINSHLSRMDRLRAEIVAAKLACRNMVARVLSGQQWKKLVEMYEAQYM